MSDSTRSRARDGGGSAAGDGAVGSESIALVPARAVHDPGDSRFLYPFLGERETDLEAVPADVRRSVLMKSEGVAELRRQTLLEGAGARTAGAAELRRRLEAGGTLLVFGNGGSAIANDIGTDAIFSRQVIAYGRSGDVALGISTSGNSRNVIEVLAEARRRDLLAIALVGYDGGRVAAEGLADHVVVTRSEHIPRIQEAQASAYHLLRELVEITREED